MIVKANAAGILGTGHAVPDKILTNADMEKIVETSDEWISSRTGIKQRHFAPEGVNVRPLYRSGREGLGTVRYKSGRVGFNHCLYLDTGYDDSVDGLHCAGKSGRRKCSRFRLICGLLGICIRCHYCISVY